MGVIARILARDLKRILTNPVAVIVAVGVCLLPSLYAWVNILANWDPYENTGGVPVAVVIEDAGAQIPGMGEVNAGEMIRERLEENHQLGWDFVDGEDQAVKGQFYLYPHDYPNRWVDQQYLPDAIKNRVYYHPGENKNEQAAAAYWKRIKGR